MQSSILALVLLGLTSQALSSDICQAPQSESVFFLTNSRSDFYVANDFTQGKVLITFGDNGHASLWCIVDLVSGYTYLNTPEGGCKKTLYTDEQNALFEQCLPDTAVLERSGDVDFYSMSAPTLDWLVGMQPVPDTEYYFRHFSRFFHENVVSEDSTYGVVYQYSLGISDPTVFDKDLSVCEDAPLDRASK
ncbi:hypothetical protein EGW08_006351 [Elysia chlorotica]|uniref:Uncharacterized protein n=1 Tax=Elysia chlorotica TaxID=188477 RepID=A0A433TWF8_ELYCH|nr:hypothetical protein EGW08_006351 [Elysia chlorotica]